MRLTWRKFRSDTKREGSVELSRFFMKKLNFLVGFFLDSCCSAVLPTHLGVSSKMVSMLLKEETTRQHMNYGCR